MNYLKNIIIKRREEKKIYNQLKHFKEKKKIVHMLTPLHGNMGDQAIVYATNEFLKKKFSDYEIIEVYKKDIHIYAKVLKKILNKNDIIVLIGGGNMGNLWIDEEIDRRFVIQKFPNNKIISMPQTISFTKDLEGEKEFNKTKEIYNKHKSLTLIAREKKSFEIMKKNFLNAKIILNPDTVFYLQDVGSQKRNKRELIMTCLRSDKEGVLGKEKDLVIEHLNSNYSNVINYDTVVSRIVTKDKREANLQEMLNMFSSSRIVITDRLHGMIFACITQTPCIVTKSLDHKITGTYEWIKELNYIKLVDKLDIQCIDVLINELTNLQQFDSIDFRNTYFNSLHKKLCEEKKNENK